MIQEDLPADSPGVPERELTVKQKKFAAAYLATHGNGVAAARVAGYTGGPNQLAVQASVNLRNPKIRQSIAEVLEAQGCTLERAVLVVAEAMQATRRRSFLDKQGNIVYADAEPDHKTRLHAAAMRFHLQGPTLSPAWDEEEAIGERAVGADLQADPVAPKAGVGEPGPAGEASADDPAQLDPADRVLFEQATKIEAELAEIDPEPGDRGGEHGTDQ